MNPDAILALISDLMANIYQLREENGQLQAANQNLSQQLVVLDQRLEELTATVHADADHHG